MIPITTSFNTIILIQSMSRLGGTEIVALNLLRALRECSINAAIFSIESYDGKEECVFSVDDDIKSHYNIQASSVLDKLLFPDRKNRALMKMVYDLCRKHNVKTIINFTYENLSIIPVDKGITTIGVYHWSVCGYEQSLFEIAYRKGLIARCVSKYILRRQFNKLHKVIGKTDYSVALTESGACELRALADSDNVVVIPNFLPYNKTAEVKPHSKNRRAVYVGRLSVEKGVYHLLDIWGKVAAKLEDVTLFIYGSGDELPEMERIIAERKIPRVEFKGFEQNAAKIYEGADLLLCTSETEGFGMVLIEAMYFGVVPMAFDCPVSPKELIADAGLAIECFDIDRYAQQVVDLFENDEKRLQLRERGIRRAQQFLKQNVIEQWKRLLVGNIL